jgi:hypothetical protein
VAVEMGHSLMQCSYSVEIGSGREDREGEDLYRISPLGRIIGSTQKKHTLNRQKNLKIINSMHIGCIYNSKKFQPKI